MALDMADLRNRPPGYSLLRKLHQMQAQAPAPSAWELLLSAKPTNKPATESWQLGYDGEVAVGELLGELRAQGWEVLHSVPIGQRGADVDHLVISPSGLVFVINTKHHPDKVVEYAREALRVNGLKQHHLTNSLDEVAKVRQRLRRVGVPARDVQPLLTFVNLRELRVKGKCRVPLVVSTSLVEHLLAAEASRAVDTKFSLNPRVYTEHVWVGRTTVDEIDYVAFGRQLSKKVQNQDLKRAILTVIGEGVTYLIEHPEARRQLASYAPSPSAVVKETRAARNGVIGVGQSGQAITQRTAARLVHGTFSATASMQDATARGLTLLVPKRCLSRTKNRQERHDSF